MASHIMVYHALQQGRSSGGGGGGGGGGGVQVVPFQYKLS